MHQLWPFLLDQLSLRSQDFSSRDQPFQTFLWSDYHASPGTSYDFTIIAEPVATHRKSLLFLFVAKD
jgi:hypothetical protein